VYKRQGTWWLSLQIEDHPTMKGMLNAKHGNRLGDLINFTTITDGTNGIFELYRLLNAKNDPDADKYLKVCQTVGDWMISNMYIEKEALFYNILDPKTGNVWRDKSPHHPNVERASLLQVARPNNEGYFFKDLYVETGEKRYRDVFINLCDGLVKRQGNDGLWMDFEPNDLNNRGGKIHPRFNVWYAESLLEGYELTGNEDYLLAAIKTAKKMAKMQQKDGTIYYYNYLDGQYREGSITGSAISFAAILWLKIQNVKGTQIFNKEIERALNWVLVNRFPMDHPDENLKGAFLETRSKKVDGEVVISVRDIATAFGLRFLSLYLQTM